jgi:hypothetical protein
VVKLGRGAMEITCKAFNVDLHRTVTLKVIIEKYVGDESATVRLLAYLEGISICILSISHMSTIVARETQIRIRLSYLFISFHYQLIQEWERAITVHFRLSLGRAFVSALLTQCKFWSNMSLVNSVPRYGVRDKEKTP